MINKIMLDKLLPFKEIRNYEVRVNIVSESEYKKNLNELTYDIAYQYVQEREQNNFVQFRKYNIKQNDKVILDLFDDVLLNVSKCLHQLDFLTDKTGSIIEVLNWEEIKELWFAQRAKVELTYKGNIINEFLDKIEENLIDPILFHELMNGDLFIFFFFYPIFQEFKVVMPENQESANSWIVVSQTRETPKPYVEETTRELNLKNMIGRSDIYYTIKEQLHFTDSDDFRFSICGHSKKHKGVIDSLALMLNKDCGNQPFYSVIEGEYVLMPSGAIKKMEIKTDSRLGSLYRKKITIICNLKGE